MYDLDRYEPWHDLGGVPLDRLTHLILVDGRLVDVWSEPARGTRWEHHAERFDEEARLSRLPPTPPPKPPHQQVLEWLDTMCGGRAAVDALDVEPLVEDGLDLPEVPTSAQRERLESTAELLDAVAARWFDVETSFAFRSALLLVWAEDPETITEMRSAALVAGGICWTVGKANGCYRPAGDLSVRRVQEALDLSGSLSAPGQKIKGALHGFRSWPATTGFRPAGVPDLLPLGHAGLLLAPTRQILLRLRDRAVLARDSDFYRAG